MLRGIARKIRARLNVPARPRFTSDDRRYSLYDIGEGTYGAPDVIFYDAGAQLRIGKYCSIGPHVTILLGGEHHHEWVTSYPFSLQFDNASSLPGYPYSRGDVTIGNDVWIGYGAVILSGVTLGNGSVIAAGSVVTKDVEPYTLVGGIPAKLIRPRFHESIIKALQEIAWWDWPPSKISEFWGQLQSPNIDEFVEHHVTANISKKD
jgi:acetyltransferase-like isoleucine patch superfamily enzyme